MKLLPFVKALSDARDDADAGLLDLVLELRGDMLVYGYKCSEAMNTKIITIKELEQLRFLHDVVYGKCSEMIKEMIAHDIKAKG